MSRIRYIVSEGQTLALTDLEYNEVRHMLDEDGDGNFAIRSSHSWRDVENALEELAEDCGAY